MNRFVYKLLLISVLISFSLLCSAQNENRIFTISYSFHFGNMLTLSQKAEILKGSKPKIQAIDIAWLYKSENAWKVCYCYPKIGFSFSYINPDKVDILGRGFSSAFYLQPYFFTYCAIKTIF